MYYFVEDKNYNRIGNYYKVSYTIEYNTNNQIIKLRIIQKRSHYYFTKHLLKE